MNSSDNGLSFYECSHCGKKMAKLETFQRHACEKLKRFKLCRTKRGLDAYNDYVYWISIKGRTIKKFQTFIDSRFFNSFVEFQSFSAKKGLPNKKMYIEYMCARKISPMLWRHDEMYESFIEHYDSTVSPLDKAKCTLYTMFKLSRIIDCDITDVFDNLLASEVAKLIHERRFSPWLLLLSKRFLKYLHMLNDPAQHLMIVTVINPTEWREKFSSNHESVKQIKKIVAELEI